MIHNVVDFRAVKAARCDGARWPNRYLAAERVNSGSVEALERFRCRSSAGGRPGGQPSGLVNVLDVLLDHEEIDSLGKYIRRIVTTTEEEPAYRIVQQLRAARLGLAASWSKRKVFAELLPSRI